MTLSIKAQKIQSKLIADLHRSIFNEVYVKGDSSVYLNYQVSFSNETHSSINIDYDDFEAFSFTFVNVRDSKDSYRVDIENKSYHIFNQEDYEDILTTLKNKYKKA